MDEPKTIEISPFSFWMITAIIGATLTGFTAWIYTTNNSINEIKIDVTKIVTQVDNIEKNVAQNLAFVNRVEQIDAKLQVLTATVSRNTLEMSSMSSDRFKMQDYERYIKPQIDSLFERVSKLERNGN